MPGLDEHQSSKYVKIAFIGDSGTGKTGALVSLVAAGYKLRILDLDNGLDSLKAWVKHDCPEKLTKENIQYVTIRDKIVSTPGGPRVPNPTAMVKALDTLNKWEDGSIPSEWGEDTILVVDSLSRYGRASLFWAKGLNPTVKDPRQWFGAGQDAIQDMLALLTGGEFNANVIVISHVRISESQDGTNKGYMNSLGKALGPIIPSYFNTMVLAETSGSGTNLTRTIRTVPTNLIDLKTPAPFAIDGVLPLGTGLATVFQKLKEL